MINIWTVIIILFIHWIADFVFQSEWQAVNKSKNMSALLSHTSRYSFYIAAFVFGLSGFHLIPTLMIFSITFICHTITDYITSRVNSKLALKASIDKKYHNFFVSIGFDQWLHAAQLILTFYYLI